MLTQRHDAVLDSGAGLLSPEDAETALRSAGLRVTAPRLATLTVIAENPHADAETLAQGVRDRLGAVSRQAVYDVLAALTEAGLVRRVTVDERRSRYELARHDNHHHLICRNCGLTVEIEAKDVEQWAHRTAALHGFTEAAHVVDIFGLCTPCTNKREAERAAAA